MEKFSRWDDLKTGVNPFVIVVPKTSAGGATAVVDAVVGTILLVLRVPVLLIIAAWLLLIGTLTALLPVPALSRILRLLLEGPACRAALIFLGVYNTPDSELNRRQLRLTPNAAAVGTVRSGDLVLCNHTSFMDVLYLNARFSPLFMVSAVNGDVRIVTFLGALLASVQATPASFGGSDAGSVLKAARGALGGPIVFFPEAGRSNGRAVLKFSSALVAIGNAVRALDAKSRPVVHCIGVRTNFHATRPAYSVASAVMNALRIAARMHTSLVASHLPEGFNPQPTGEGDQAEWAETVRSAMQQLLGRDVQLVEWDAAEFNDFLAAWQNPTAKIAKRAATAQTIHHG